MDDGRAERRAENIYQRLERQDHFDEDKQIARLPLTGKSSPEKIGDGNID